MEKENQSTESQSDGVVKNESNENTSELQGVQINGQEHDQMVNQIINEVDAKVNNEIGIQINDQISNQIHNKIDNQTDLVPINLLKRNSEIFSIRIFRRIARIHVNENFALAPFSLLTILFVILAGATKALCEDLISASYFKEFKKEQILKPWEQVVQRYKSNFPMKIISNFFYDSKFCLKNSYKRFVKRLLAGNPIECDFGDADDITYIKEYFENKSRKKITKILDQITMPENIQSLFINSSYLEAKWKYPFPFFQTRKEQFWFNNSESTEIEFMEQKNEFLYGELQKLKASAIVLPLKNSEIYLLFILPKERSGMRNLVQNLKNFPILYHTIYMKTQEIIVKIPKFKIESTVIVNRVLKEMGLESVFVEDDSNFEDMLKMPHEPESSLSFQISLIAQKTVFSIDEEGVQAGIPKSDDDTKENFCIFKDTPIFNADHPFIFVLCDKDFVFLMGKFIGK